MIVRPELKRQHRDGLIGLVALLLACLALINIAYAQQSSASVRGIFRDPNGTAVPSAEIVLHNTATNVERRLVTNDSGEYVFLQVVPWEYTIQTSKAGFQKSKIQPFRLGVNQASTIDINLQIDEVQQTVTVEATGEAI
jgi:Carboxypeptidase regulatory-like domain